MPGQVSLGILLSRKVRSSCTCAALSESSGLMEVIRVTTSNGGFKRQHELPLVDRVGAERQIAYRNTVPRGGCSDTLLEHVEDLATGDVHFGVVPAGFQPTVPVAAVG